MNQPTPNVTAADLNRVVRREFVESELACILDLLNGYGSEPWHREPVRVQLAVLKLASGDLQEVRKYIELAKTDYRDVLAMAEYPGYMHRTLPPDKLSEKERERVIDEDWQQYSAWLNRR